MPPYQIEVSRPTLRIRTPRVEPGYESENDEDRAHSIGLRKNRAFYASMIFSSVTFITLAARTCKWNSAANLAQIYEMSPNCKVAIPVMAIWLFGSFCMYLVSCEVGRDYGRQHGRRRTRSDMQSGGGGEGESKNEEAEEANVAESV